MSFNLAEFFFDFLSEKWSFRFLTLVLDGNYKNLVQDFLKFILLFWVSFFLANQQDKFCCVILIVLYYD